MTTQEDAEMITHRSANVKEATVMGKKIGLAVGTVLLSALTLQPAWSQSPGDVVVIGDSPGQWSQNQSYWNQLLGLTGNRPQPQSLTAPNQTAADPRALEQQLLRNIRISGLRLSPIIKLNGSSQVSGTITNGNRQAVTVASVNFQVLDRSGNLIQTSSATPQPATISPGQSVTFTTVLETVPPDVGASVVLLNPAVQLQGGV